MKVQFYLSVIIVFIWGNDMRKHKDNLISFGIGILSSIFATILIYLMTKLFNILNNDIKSISIFILLSLLCLIIMTLFYLLFINYKKNVALNIEFECILQNEAELEMMLDTEFANAKEIKILDLRGFLYTQQDKKLFRRITTLDIPIQFLFSNPLSEASRFRESKTPYKKEGAFEIEIQTSIDSLSNLSKKNILIRTFNEHIIFRLIFINDCFLYLTPFRDGKFISDAPTYKIRNGSSLYECFDNYYSEIWNNKSEKVR